MPGGTRYQQGNILFEQVLYLPAVTVPNLPANSTVSQTVTIPGVVSGDVIGYSQQATVAGISVENAFVSATNVVTFLWSNTTTGAVNGTAAQPFLIVVTRPENAVLGLAALPTAVV